MLWVWCSSCGLGLEWWAGVGEEKISFETFAESYFRNPDSQKGQRELIETSRPSRNLLILSSIKFPRIFFPPKFLSTYPLFFFFSFLNILYNSLSLSFYTKFS